MNKLPARRCRLAGLLAPTFFLLALQVSSTYIAPARAQASSETFPETGKTVSGKFLDYWNTHGGLAQQGYPISEEMQEVSDTNGKTYTVQYFERAEFEMHPENQPPNDVLLSLLGVFAYKQKYSNGAPNQTPSDAQDRRLFSETGKTVGGIWLDYWSTHGGLAQQGLPISDIFQEKSDLDGKTYMVQHNDDHLYFSAVAVDAEGNVYVADLGNRRVQKFDPSGNFLLKWGSEGSGNGQFISPDAIAVDSEGDVYVGEDAGKCVQKFDPSGKFLWRIGGKVGSGEGEFASPAYVAMDTQDNIYVTDYENDRISIFNKDGHFLRMFGTSGRGGGEFRNPTGVALDGWGNIYVVNDDPTRNFIQKFDNTGRYLGKFPITHNSSVDSLYGLATDGQGNIYVSDITYRAPNSEESNVQKFHIK